LVGIETITLSRVSLSLSSGTAHEGDANWDVGKEAARAARMRSLSRKGWKSKPASVFTAAIRAIIKANKGVYGTSPRSFRAIASA